MRKLSPAAKEHKAAYDAKYREKNVTRKSVYFNKNNPEDQEIVQHLDSKGQRNISGYIKGLVKKDMDAGE